MKAAVLMGLLVVAGQVAAKTPRAPTSDEIHREVGRIAQQYVDAIGCIDWQRGPTATLIAPIAPYDPAKPGFERRDSEYLVWVFGEEECGGRAAGHFFAVSVLRTYRGDYYVDSRAPRPPAEMETPFVSRVVQAGADSVVIESREHMQRDGYHAPSLRVHYRFSRKNRGHAWQLVERSVAGKTVPIGQLAR